MTQGIEGVADLNVEQQIERPQLLIRPRRTLLAQYGITLPEFAEFVNSAIGGEVVSQVQDGARTFDLTVRVADDDLSTMERIRNLLIDTNTGQKVPLADVAEVMSTAGPNTINRENATA